MAGSRAGAASTHPSARSWILSPIPLASASRPLASVTAWACAASLDIIILIFFVACGISRLARYNVTAGQLSDDSGKVKYFEGTPIPSSVFWSPFWPCAFTSDAPVSIYPSGESRSRPRLSSVCAAVFRQRLYDDQQDVEDSKAVTLVNHHRRENNYAAAEIDFFFGSAYPADTDRPIGSPPRKRCGWRFRIFPRPTFPCTSPRSAAYYAEEGMIVEIILMAGLTSTRALIGNSVELGSASNPTAAVQGAKLKILMVFNDKPPGMLGGAAEPQERRLNCAANAWVARPSAAWNTAG